MATNMEGGIPLSQLCRGRLTHRRCGESAVDGGVDGTGFCSKCYYPGCFEDYQHYRDMRDEGYSHHQAALQAGFIDP